MDDRSDSNSVFNNLSNVDAEIELSESRDIVEHAQSTSPRAYTIPTAQAQTPMWAMQPPQPYVPQTSSQEEEIPIGRAKIRSPNGGSTHFNVYLNTNKSPQQQPPPPQQPMPQYGTPQQQQPQYGAGWGQQQPQMPIYIQPGGCSQPMFSPAPPPVYNNCYPPMNQQPYGMMNGMGMGGGPPPNVVYMNGMPQQQQPRPPTPPKEDKKEEKPPTPPPTPPPMPDPIPVPMAPPSPPPPPPKPTADEMTPISIAAIIIASIAFIMGILCLVKTEEAYHAYMAYEKEGNGNESSLLYDTWQMCRNIALGAGASCVSIFSLAFILIFWAGMQYKQRRHAVSTCVMTFFLIGAWILFAFSFVVDVVVLVLAFDEDNVVYPEIVWAAFLGHCLAWLCMLVNEELTRRWEEDWIDWDRY